MDAIHKGTNKAVKSSINTMQNLGGEIVYLNAEIDSDYLVNEVSVHLHDLKDHLNVYLRVLPEQAIVHSVEEILMSGKYHAGI